MTNIGTLIRADVTAKRTSKRRQLMAGGAMAMCLATLVAHAPAAAQQTTFIPPGQAFQGTPAVVTGSATVVQTATLDTITVNTPQAVINWTPNDSTGTGTIDFLPVGRSARFTSNAEFTVLNRIIPRDAAGMPVARLIAFYGTITSDIGGQQRGGSVWFYSPGGIFVGATGVINVGSLVLTSRDIDFTGGLFGLNKEIRFRDPGIAGANGAAVTVAQGASISALHGNGNSSYIALVAPRIVQAGAINVDGSVALVAAEQADININAGLFDITVLVGTSDPEGIVHTGQTGGTIHPTNPSAAFLVAVPKNQAMTMLLSGTIGFVPGQVASVNPDGNIVLSSGYNVFGGQIDVTSNANTTGSIRIGDTLFLNQLHGAATDSIYVRPTNSCAPFCSPNNPFGQVLFNGEANLSATRLIDMSVGNAQVIAAGRGLFLRSGVDGTGGTIRLTIDNAPPISTSTSGGGLILVKELLLLDANGNGIQGINNGTGVGGSVLVDILGGTLSASDIFTSANGFGDLTDSDDGANGQGGNVIVRARTGGLIETNTLTASAYGIGGDGLAISGSGIGGQALVVAQGGGTVTIATNLTVRADGFGTLGPDQSGNGTGGSATVEIADGLSAISAALTDISAQGFGGGFFDGAPGTIAPIGGDGRGGIAQLLSSGTANLGDLSVTAEGNGGDAQTVIAGDPTRGGDGVGGTANIIISGGTTDALTATVSARGTGGSSNRSGVTRGGGTGGRGTGGSALVDASNGGLLRVADSLFIDAAANSISNGEQTVGDITGGTVRVRARTNGQIEVGGSLFAETGASTFRFANNLPAINLRNLTGGNIFIEAEGGIIRANILSADAAAGSVDFTGSATSIQAGNITLSATLGGLLTTTGADTDLAAFAFGPNGLNGTGGTIRLLAGNNSADTGSIDLFDASIQADGNVGGRIELIDNVAGAGIRIGDLLASARSNTPSSGDISAGGSGIYFRSASGPITITNGATLNTSGTIQVDAFDSGGLSVGGQLLTTSGDFIARHINRAVADQTIAASTIVSTASNNIDFQTGTAVQAAGVIDLIAAQSIAFDRLTTGTGAMTLVAGSTITGTYAETTSAAPASFVGANGVSLATVRVPGTLLLRALNGAVVVGDLRSGLVSALGRTVALISTATQVIDLAEATAGTVTLRGTSGDLTVNTGRATGEFSTTTDLGALSVGQINGGAITLTSATTATLNNAVTATGALNVSSRGATTVNNVATGSSVRISSGDIVIASTGRIGTAGTTTLVDLINSDSSARTYIGGGDQAGAYSLSAAEMTRIYGNDVTIRAPRVISTVLPRQPDVVIRDFAFVGGGGAGANLGATGTLRIETPGSARVVGAAQLTSMTSSNGFTLSAAESIEVILGQGSIRLIGNSPGGTLTLVSDTIAVATSSAISDIAVATSIDAINTRLSLNDGVTSEEGALSANTINLNVVGGVYIQNSGTSDRNADRRGFTANSLNISTAGTGTSIVINGRIANTAGVLQTGQDAIALALINGVAAGPGGAFVTGSTINGCTIASGASCRGVTFVFPIQDTLNQIIDEDDNDSGEGSGEDDPYNSLISIRDSEPPADEPLLDEPITGSGNDDLWVEPTDG